MKEERKYYIKLDDKQLVEVTKEVYTVYRQMERKERYQEERDLEKGLIHYDSWDTKNINGQDYIRYTEESTEEDILLEDDNESLDDGNDELFEGLEDDDEMFFDSDLAEDNLDNDNDII